MTAASSLMHLHNEQSAQNASIVAAANTHVRGFLSTRLHLNQNQSGSSPRLPHQNGAIHHRADLTGVVGGESMLQGQISPMGNGTIETTLGHESEDQAKMREAFEQAIQRAEQ